MAEETGSGGASAWPRRTAVIGAGTMGLGVAEYFAATGLQVRMVDATPELTHQACAQLKRRAHGHVESGLLPAEALERVASVAAADDVASAVDNVDFVFEAVPEQLELKHEVLAAVSAAAPPDAVIATNTSSLPIDDLSSAVTHPRRFLGTHWFNPPEWIPGVEIIPGTATDPDIVERIRAFLRSIGKRPAVVQSSPGFVANRIQMALFLEAVACVEDGLASPREVDEVVRSCFGFRLPFFGPFQIADMAGLDVYAAVSDTLDRGLGEAFRAPALLRAQVEQGRFGTKSGAGFYDYSEAERDGMLLERDRRYAALSELAAKLPPLEPGDDPS